MVSTKAAPQQGTMEQLTPLSSPWDEAGAHHKQRSLYCLVFPCPLLFASLPFSCEYFPINHLNNNPVSALLLRQMAIHMLKTMMGMLVEKESVNLVLRSLATKRGDGEARK